VQYQGVKPKKSKTQMYWNGTEIYTVSQKRVLPYPWL